MKILVLGSGGMAGHVVTLYLKEKGYEIYNLSANSKLDDNTIQMDLTKKEEFENFLRSNRFNVIINCVGLLIEQSEKRKDLSTYLNSFLPHYLEYFYKDTDTKIIHLSTDCVFSGESAPYYENSVYDGELFYDRTKALGEIINDKDLTFRMSIIGPDMSEKGIGLFNWFAKQEGDIFGYTEAIWNGITTIELAKSIEAAIKQDITGIYHLVPNDNISKHDLLKLFKEVFGINNLNILPKDDAAFDKTLINTRKDFDFKVSDYKSMIKEMKNWIDNHKSLYPHYK
jgi:dTDP-4-dehydrorhamnose reductase